MVIPLPPVPPGTQTVYLDEFVIYLQKSSAIQNIFVISSSVIIIAIVFVFCRFLLIQIYKNFRYFTNNQYIIFDINLVELALTSV